MAQEIEITVVDRQEPIVPNSVDYIPFGVKTLKLRVRRDPSTHPKLGKVWIIPKGYVPPDIDADDPARWRAYGTAEGDSDLWVAWGAGHEKGFCVKTTDILGFNKEAAPLDDDAAHYVYLHLIHRPHALDHASADKALTVQAVGEHGEVYGEKAIQLKAPESNINPVRAAWDWDLDAGVSTIQFRGAGNQKAHLPLYVSRWWPAQRVSYVPMDAETRKFVKGLKIAYTRRKDGQDQGHIQVTANGTLIADIGGYLALPVHDCRLMTAEVMRFLDGYHLVVRLWFYWLHINFSTCQLKEFAPADRSAAWETEAERVLKGLNTGPITWHKREEVPDIERFDFLLDPQNLDFKYVGTDTHWQEFWGTVEVGEPARAEIASLLQIPKVALQSKSVKKKDKAAVFDPAANGLCDLVNEWSDHPCPYRGEGRLITADQPLPDESVVCPRCGSRFAGQGTREVGLWDKHAPLLLNAQVSEQATSTNVLEG